MDRGVWAIAAVLAVASGILTVPAGAAPAIATGAGAVKTALSETTNVDQARWYRRCWHTRRGVRTCRRVWVGPPYGYRRYYDGPRRPYRGRHYRGYGGGMM